MTEQQTNTGAPGAAPGGSPAGNTGGDFVRTRARQMSETTMRPAPAQAQLDLEHADRSGDGAPPAEPRQQQHPPAEGRIKVGDADYSPAELQDAIAARAEAQSRKATLPTSADGYEVRLPDGFQGPEGVKFEFDMQNPLLKTAREIAHKHGLDQQAFSEMLSVYASSQMGSQIQQARLRDVNMQALGAAAPQRLDAVTTWLKATAGESGVQVSNFLRQYPSAAFVKAFEGIMRKFTSQGGVEFSQSHRAQQEESAGKIPGYDGMSFAQKRAHQMQQQFGPKRGGNER